MHLDNHLRGLVLGLAGAALAVVGTSMGTGCCPQGVVGVGGPVVVGTVPDDGYYFFEREVIGHRYLGRQVWVNREGRLVVVDEPDKNPHPMVIAVPEPNWPRTTVVAGNFVYLPGQESYRGESGVEFIDANDVVRTVSQLPAVKYPTIGTIVYGEAERSFGTLQRAKYRRYDRLWPLFVAAAVRRPRRPWLELGLPEDSQDAGARPRFEAHVATAVDVRVLPGSRVALQLYRDGFPTQLLWESGLTFVAKPTARMERRRDPIPPGPGALYTVFVSLPAPTGNDTGCATLELQAIRTYEQPPSPRDMVAWTAALKTLPETSWNVTRRQIVILGHPGSQNEGILCGSGDTI